MSFARCIRAISAGDLNMRQPAVTGVALANCKFGASFLMPSKRKNRTRSSMPMRPERNRRDAKRHAAQLADRIRRVALLKSLRGRCFCVGRSAQRNGSGQAGGKAEEVSSVSAHGAFQRRLVGLSKEGACNGAEIIRSIGLNQFIFGGRTCAIIGGTRVK